MAAPAAPSTAHDIPFPPARSRWEKIFLVLASALPASILLKVGHIQFLEILYLVQIGVLFVVFARRDFRVTWFPPLLRLGTAYFIIGTATMALAISSLRFDFIYPADLTPLGYPVVISIARLTELVANVATMLFLIDQFRRSNGKIRFSMLIYFWVGVASATFAILSYPLDVLHIVSWGAYSDTHRLRGFYNEGGPFGSYLVSVFIVGIVLYKLGWQPRRRILAILFCLFFVFLGSQSRAGVVCILLFLFFNGLFAPSIFTRVVIAASTVTFLIAVSQAIDLGKVTRDYQQAGAAYERASHFHRGDPNFVNGRVAGAFIVPRMILAHPLTGVGLGNYGLVRNSVEFRGASVFTDSPDDPGMGLLGVTAELGVPLTLFLLACFFVPFIVLRRRRAPLWICNLALVQPIVHLGGAQLNSTFPWLVTAFALGIAWSVKPLFTPTPTRASQVSLPVAESAPALSTALTQNGQNA